MEILIFIPQLEKSREATDEANLRAAYAEVVASALTETAANTDVTDNGDDSYQVVVTAKQSDTSKWVSGDEVEIGGIKVKAAASWTVKADSD